MKPGKKLKKAEMKNNEIVQLITFRMDNKIYAIEISHVREINRVSYITRVPKSEDFIEGVMNLRGFVIPVVNIRKRFNLELENGNKAKKLIIIDYEDSPVGLMVDEISEVVKIKRDNIEYEKEKMDEIGTEFIKGIGKTDDNILPVLDIYKLIGREKREENEKV